MTFYEECYRKYHKDLTSYIRMRAHPSDIEDISQTVWCKLYTLNKKFETFEDFRPWMFGVAKYTIIDVLRKRKMHDYVDIDLLPEKCSEKVYYDEKALLSRKMERLSSKDRDILEWRYSECMGMDKIAEHLKIKNGAARVRVHRIMQKLQEAMGRNSNASSKSNGAFPRINNNSKHIYT